jgi:hypothetical protein
MKKKTRNNVFLGKKTKVVSAVRRATTPYGAARILSKELNVPFQVAKGIVTLSDRTLRRLCNGV